MRLELPREALAIPSHHYVNPRPVYTYHELLSAAPPENMWVRWKIPQFFPDPSRGKRLLKIKPVDHSQYLTDRLDGTIYRIISRSAYWYQLEPIVTSSPFVKPMFDHLEYYHSVYPYRSRQPLVTKHFIQTRYFLKGIYLLSVSYHF
jgi:hypothetical protein